MGEVIGHLFGGMSTGSLLFWAMILLVGGFLLFQTALFGFCAIKVRRLYKKTAGCNCLYWHHPDSTPLGTDYLELKKIFLDENEYIKAKFRANNWPLEEKHYKDNGDLMETRLKNTRDAFEIQKADWPKHAPDWGYKETWWQLWKVRVKWVYEEKGADGNITVNPFDPDEVIQGYLDDEYPVPPSSELAEDLRCSQNWARLNRQPNKWLQRLALGAPVMLGIACIFGIVILGVFLLG